MRSKIFNLLYLLVIQTIVHYSSGSEDLDDPFTPTERAALNKFRPLVNHLLVTYLDQTDQNLMTFLRAKEMNVDAAVEMITESLKWRRHNRINSIVNETILTFNPAPYTIEGYDREGHPLLMFTPTHIDHRKLIIQGLKEKVVRYWFQMLERGRLAIYNSPKMANGRNVTKATVILDLHGYNLKQHFCLDCISVYKEWFIGMEMYYPEALKHFVILNIPKTAKQLIEIILPLLSPNSAKALKMFEPDKKQWGPYLNQIIAPNQLPIRFGGTKNSSKDNY